VPRYYAGRFALIDIKTVVPKLSCDFKSLIAILECMISIASYSESVYEPFSNTIINFIVSNILMKNVAAV
jgi:hypothetical protein